MHTHAARAATVERPPPAPRARLGPRYGARVPDERRVSTESAPVVW